jgi:hypothetical protein
MENGFAMKPLHKKFSPFFISSPVEEKKFSPFSILQSPRMGPPPFKESVPRPHYAFYENGKKEV